MKPLRTVAGSTSALLVAALLTVVPAAIGTTSSTASAVDRCYRLGAVKTKVGKATFAWDIAQHDAEENYSGKPLKLVFKVGSSRTRTNNFSGSASVSGSVKAGIFGKLEIGAGVEMGTIGTKTKFSETTREYNLRSGDRYHFTQGTGRWKATAKVFKCIKGNPNGDYYRWSQVSKGPVTGYTGRTKSVVGCKYNPPRKTLAYAAKKRWC